MCNSRPGKLFFLFVFAFLFVCGSENYLDERKIFSHSHNDYQKDRPLFEALENGCGSIEADIIFMDGELFVAHDTVDIQPGRTLRSLYLEPLRDIAKENGGKILSGERSLILLVDIKSEPGPTYHQLKKTLKEYSTIITAFREGEIEERAVTVIVSGNRPLEVMKREQVRYAGYDGRIVDLNSGLSIGLMPLISDNWNSCFKWKGEGKMPVEESELLEKYVLDIHEEGRMVRFWATPDSPRYAREAVWKKLVGAGVDFINTDSLALLSEFLEEYGQDYKD